MGNGPWMLRPPVTVMTAPTARLFTALTLTDTARSRLDGWWRRHLDGRLPDHWHAQTPANWHVTLAFYGDVPCSQLGHLVDRLRQTLTQRPPLSLQSRGWGVFPDCRHARVLWLGIDGQGLARLARHCQQIHNVARHESGHYIGHLTLARCRRPQPLDPSTLPSAPTLAWRSTAVSLFQSQRQGTAVCYRQIANIPLSGQSNTPAGR